jgi:protein-disulfide isomerase
MAQSRNLKPFYLGLVVLAVAGAAGIWWARQSSRDAGPREVGPVPVSATAFEGYTLGSDSAPVEIIEYSNFACPWCAQFAILTKPDVRERLISAGMVRWVYRDFLLGGHDAGNLAHQAAACTGEQGLFWPMHDQLFYNQRRWMEGRRPGRTFRGYARDLGVSMDQYDDCMDEQRYLGRILATKEQALTMGIQSTPTFIIGGLMVAGAISYDSLRALVTRAMPAESQ